VKFVTERKLFSVYLSPEGKKIPAENPARFVKNSLTGYISEKNGPYPDFGGYLKFSEKLKS
jgi:hypothetical protein